MLTKISDSARTILFAELKSLDYSWTDNYINRFQDCYSDHYCLVYFDSVKEAGKFATKIAGIVGTPIRVNVAENNRYVVIFRNIQTLRGSKRLIGECKFTYKEFLEVFYKIEL